jgi:hypothetical protein
VTWSPLATETLSALVEHDSRQTIELDFDAAADVAPDATGRAVNDVLLEAERRGWIVGQRDEGDGSIAWWSTLRLTVDGLRGLGDWPPAGREHELGVWDDGHWGARPLLESLHAKPPAHGFYLTPVGEETTRWLEWTAALLLLEAGLISGRIGDDGVDTLRITPEGAHALDPTPRNPLHVAQAKLRSGARVDAIITAVLALGGRLKEIAADRGVPVTHTDGRPLTLMKLSVNLREAGAYDETDRAQIEAWLKLRNDLVHPDGTAVGDARVAAVIQSIGVFLDEHP